MSYPADSTYFRKTNLDLLVIKSLCFRKPTNIGNKVGTVQMHIAYNIYKAETIFKS